MKEYEILSEYEDYLSLQGFGRRTIYNYKIDVSKLICYLDEYSLLLSQIRVNEAQEFQRWLIDKNKYNSATILNILKAASSFFNFLKTKKIVYSNPFYEIKKVRADESIPKNILTEKQMQKLLDELMQFMKPDTIKQKVRRYRVHIISELMYSTGLRMSEVANLKIEDIDFDSNTLQVVEGKGGISRIAFLNSFANNILGLYVSEIRELTLYNWSNKELLFGADNNTLRMVVNTELKKICENLRFKTITSHSFRHSLGTHLLRAGCGIRYIQAILGHRRLRSTEVYTKVDKEKLKEEFEKYHPRKWKK